MSAKARSWDWSRDVEGSVVSVLVEGEAVDEREMLDRCLRAVEQIRAERLPRRVAPLHDEV